MDNLFFLWSLWSLHVSSWGKTASLLRWLSVLCVSQLGWLLAVVTRHGGESLPNGLTGISPCIATTPHSTCQHPSAHALAQALLRPPEDRNGAELDGRPSALLNAAGLWLGALLATCSEA